MNFVDVADELIGLIEDLQQKAAASFALTPAMEKAKLLRDRAEALQHKAFEIKEKENSSENEAIILDHCLMKLSRILMPVNYTTSGRFDFDPALAIPPLPRLQPVAELADLNPAGDSFKFLERKMVREQNRLCHALDEACELIAQTLT